LRTLLTQSTSSTQTTLLLDLAEAFKQVSADSVQSYALEGQEMATKQKDTLSLIRAYRQLGWARGIMQQDMGQLESDATAALELAEAIRDEEQVALIYLDLARAYMGVQQGGKAESYSNQALEFAQKVGNHQIMHDAYANLSYINLLKDLTEAYNFRYNALKQAEFLNDSLNIALDLMQLGAIHKWQKQDSAAYYFQASREIFSQIQNPFSEALLYYYMAEYYGDLGFTDTLLSYGLKAYELGTKANNQQALRGANTLLFNYYFNRQDYEEAAPYARSSLAIEQQKPTINYGAALMDIGQLQAATGEPDSAEASYRAAIAFGNRVNYPRIEAAARVYLGKLFKEQEKYLKAQSEFEIALTKIDRKTDLSLLDFLLLLQGETAIELKQYRKARKFYQEAIDLGKASNEFDLLRDGYEGLAECDSAMGNWQEAYAAMRAFSVWSDSVKNRSHNERTAQLETKYETAQKEAAIEKLKQSEKIQALELSKQKARSNLLIGIATVFLLAGGIVTFLLFRLRRSNQQISEQRSELASLNQTKDRLFALIAHDLRGPITGFQSLIRIFDRYLKDQQMSRLELVSQKIHQQSQQIRQLLDNLLYWALGQLGAYTPQIETFHLLGLGEEIFQIYEGPAGEKGNNLALNVDPTLEITGDRTGLGVILHNLVGNAMKFTQQGKITIQGNQSEGHTIIEVIDTGKGMNEKQLGNLFNEGQNKSTLGTNGEKGTGLGLQIVKQMVDSWQGEIYVKSQQDVGTTIQLSLPQAHFQPQCE
ncbi:MAG: HAMP domain-containing sensor histidine kinase, partial [Bacteroidota bacterium]